MYNANLHVRDGFYEKTIDSRSSDAIALALRSGSPIRMSEEVLQEVGFDADVLTDEGDKSAFKSSMGERGESREDLERMLRECEENEEYELAAEIAKKLKKL